MVSARDPSGSLALSGTHKLPIRNLSRAVPADVDLELAVGLGSAHRDCGVPCGIALPVHLEGAVVDRVALVRAPRVELHVKHALACSRVLRESRVCAPAEKHVVAVFLQRQQGLETPLVPAYQALWVVELRDQPCGERLEVEPHVLPTRAVYRAPDRARDVVVVEHGELRAGGIAEARVVLPCKVGCAAC